MTDLLLVATLRRRMICLLYELLLLVALLFVVGLLLPAFVLMVLSKAGVAVATQNTVLGQAFWLLIFGVSMFYYIRSWRRGGQTVAMQAWRLRLASRDGGPITLRQALIRLAVVTASLVLPLLLTLLPMVWHLADRRPYSIAAIMFLLLPWVWVIGDAQRQFLQDRLAGTWVLSVPVQKK